MHGFRRRGNVGLQRKPCMAPRKTQLIGWALGASWRLQTDYGATQASLSSSSLALWACGASSVISVTDVRKHKCQHHHRGAACKRNKLHSWTTHPLSILPSHRLLLQWRVLPNGKCHSSPPVVRLHLRLRTRISYCYSTVAFANFLISSRRES